VHSEHGGYTRERIDDECNLAQWRRS